MPEIIGVAIEATVARAALRSNGNLSVAEVPFDAAFPDAAVDALRERFGSVGAIALSVGLAHLEVAEPGLPPLSPDEQRRVLLRDTDRYFPVEGSVAISAPDAGTLAFATPSDSLQRWVRAFESWAPVRAIVAAPIALAAGLSVVHRASKNGSRALLVDAGANEVGFIRLTDGQVAEVRRVPVTMRETLPKDAELSGAVYYPGANGDYASAAGAISYVGASTGSMLLDAELEASFASRLFRRKLITYASLALALLALGVSVDARRERVLDATVRMSAALDSAAAPALSAKSRLAEAEREARLLALLPSQSDPLAVLATLSRTLPGDAFVERINWDGAEWRIDGSADRAASVVPSLDSTALISNVRVLTASTRFRDGARMRESFSVAFTVKGDSVAKR